MLPILGYLHIAVMHRLGVFLHWAIPSHSHISLILTVDDFTANSGYHLYSSKEVERLFSTKTSFLVQPIEDFHPIVILLCYLWFLCGNHRPFARSRFHISHSGIIYSSQHYTSHSIEASRILIPSAVCYFLHTVTSFINNDTVVSLS